MRVLPILLALAFLSVRPTAAAPPTNVTPEEAKRLADASEASLAPSAMQKLVAAQGEFATRAMPHCIDKFGTPRESFTVVVELVPDGKVVKSWLIGASGFGTCFREEMARTFKYTPPVAPFYSSFEYTYQRK